MVEDNYEEIIQKLKNSGNTQIESVKFLVKNYKLELSEADILVLNSNAWKDKLEMNKKIRKEFFDEMEKS